MPGRKMMYFFIHVMTFGIMLTSFVSSQTDEISCFAAIPYLAPCLPYLTGFGQPSSYCCVGATTLAQRADTTQNRRDLCGCLKKASAQFNVNADKAKQLPQLCNISLPFSFDPSIDCNT